MVATGPNVPFNSIVGLERNLSGFHFMYNGVFFSRTDATLQCKIGNENYPVASIICHHLIEYFSEAMRRLIIFQS